MSEPWLQEAIIEYLKSPCYVVPLLGFIDEKCIIFDTEEENKFEYSHIHEEFKHQVDAMLTEFLEELGVSPEDFLSVVQNRSSGLNSFVVNSILVVDDFQLFKAMMVKRNMDLTKEVILHLEEQSHDLAPPTPPPEETYQAGQAEIQGSAAEDPAPTETSKLETSVAEGELEEALRMSRYQFDLEEKGRKDQMGSLETEEERLLAQAISESLREKAERDQELAELEQALRLSLVIQQEAPESPRHIDVEDGAGPSQSGSTAHSPAKADDASEPPAPPSSSPPPVRTLNPVKAPPAPRPLPPPTAAPAPPAAPPPPPAPLVAPMAAPAPALRDLSVNLVPSRTVSLKAASYKAGPSTMPSADREALRSAALEAAATQKAVLMERRERLLREGKESSAPALPEEERERRAAFLKQQKERWIAVKQAERVRELEAYKAAHRSAPAPPSPAKTADPAKAQMLGDMARRIREDLLMGGKGKSAV